MPENVDQRLPPVGSRMLDRDDQRNSFVWPRSHNKGFNVHWLNDLFWIWKALKTIEEMEE